jgi:hypothetical protein
MSFVVVSMRRIWPNLSYIFDRSPAHRVADASAFDAHVVAVAHFILIVAVEFLAQKGGDVVGFDRVDGRSNQLPLNSWQVRLAKLEGHTLSPGGAS